MKRPKFKSDTAKAHTKRYSRRIIRILELFKLLCDSKCEWRMKKRAYFHINCKKAGYT